LKKLLGPFFLSHLLPNPFHSDISSRYFFQY
jgi:hypothetical protein